MNGQNQKDFSKFKQASIKLCEQTDPLTAPTGNFLRVNAQMRNLDLAKNGRKAAKRYN